MINIGGRPSRTLLYEDVVNDLYTLIDDSHLQPGDKLPPERELTEKLGISRNVLREDVYKRQYLFREYQRK